MSSPLPTCPRRTAPLLPLTAAAAMLAAVLPVPRATAGGLAVERHPDRLVITDAEGRPAAVFTFGDPVVGRPAIRDLHAPGGVMVSRPCPGRPGVDPDDHATIHPGVMLCFSDLSGADPWRGKTAVRFRGFVDEPAVVEGRVRFAFAVDYLAGAKDIPDATVVCRETSTVEFSDREAGDDAVRVVTWDADLTPGDGPVTLGDVEEMGFGIRLVKELSPRWGGRYLADHGGRDEQGCFGIQARWVDAAGEIGGRRVGVAVVDRGGIPGAPFMHARDYGWLLANPFGRRSYGRGEPAAVTLAAGDVLRLRYALVLHGDVPDERLAPLVAAVVGPPR